MTVNEQSASHNSRRFVLDAEDVQGVKSALTRYRVMAWVVGILLVVLVCVGMPLKYIWDDDRVVRWTGIPHGWLYAVLLITAYDLGRRVKWSIKWFLAIMAAGTVPFLSFVAEHFATKNVRATLRASERP
ncbi:DUF3817 domain-containing protein [Tessaracoccus sp. ZS01]|uniref:DUF3817 domain-containing protein n=1 Tax=Tessaracoccus sp. ZS01 TaxID=1906324 RepID=UPI00096EDDAF|nr:DUF3817 domain-containing protein [Tessaracoccus sp. ZS01]MCG6567651.1 DUF3817 domain-containing protein [Tessaracoccus sp. ZS01]OMG55725.1 hypothetical protein BJN44_08455 [Tessaracoccus sp. ZS01]